MTDDTNDAGSWDAVSQAWPQCPQCGELRLTNCPICKTPGTDFDQADPQFIGDLGPAPPEAEAKSCAHGCSSCNSTADSTADGLEVDPQGEPAPLVLVCGVCDEPFLPQHPRKCVRCGHAFADGYDVEPPIEVPEQLGARVTLVVVGLAVLSALLAAYFMFIL